MAYSLDNPVDTNIIKGDLYRMISADSDAYMYTYKLEAVLWKAGFSFF